MTLLPHTSGQTVGPFFHYALPFAGDSDLVPAAHPDARRLHGRVLDGSGSPVPDALIEIWQPDRAGNVPRQSGSLHRDGWTFTGWGRCATDALGGYSFSTLTPGATGTGAAPFFAVTVFARGLLDRLFTRAYLPGVDGTEPSDALLDCLTDDRRRTLLAQEDPHGWIFDITLQGPTETVFLTYPGHRQAD